MNGYNDLGAAYLQTGRFEQAAARVRKGAASSSRIPRRTRTSPSRTTSPASSRRQCRCSRRRSSSARMTSSASETLRDGYRWAGLNEKATATYDRAIALALKQLRRQSAERRGARAISACTTRRKAIWLEGSSSSTTRAPSIGRTSNLIYGDALVNALGNRPARRSPPWKRRSRPGIRPPWRPVTPT